MYFHEKFLLISISVALIFLNILDVISLQVLFGCSYRTVFNAISQQCCFLRLFTTKGITKEMRGSLDFFFSNRTISSRFCTRRSYSQIFFTISVLKNFANFTGKYLRWSLFYLSCWPEDLQILKRDSNTGVFL